METTVTVTVKPIRLAEFSGWCAALQSEAYGNLVRAGISREASHKIAMDFSSSLGRIFATGEGKFKIGKADKSGLAPLLARCKGKEFANRTTSVLRVAQVLQDLHKEGLVSGKQIPELSESLAEYVKEAQVWADAQVWAHKKPEQAPAPAPVPEQAPELVPAE